MDFIKAAILSTLLTNPGIDTVDLGHEVYNKIGVTVDITLTKAEELIEEGLVKKEYDWRSHTQYYLG